MSSIVRGQGALSLDVASVGSAVAGVESVTPFSAGLLTVVPGFGMVLGVELRPERELKIVATIVGISADERFSTTAGLLNWSSDASPASAAQCRCCH